MLVLIILFIHFVVYFFFSVIFLYLFFSFISVFIGAPFVPSSKERLDSIIKLANVKPDDKIAELGSGDGRVVVAFAKIGATVHGYEINPVLVLISRFKIRRLGLNSKAFIHWKDLWKVDYSSFNLVIVYGISKMMKRLGAKLKKELGKEARVISNGFEFPNWKYKEKQGRVYLYQKN